MSRRPTPSLTASGFFKSCEDGRAMNVEARLVLRRAIAGRCPNTALKTWWSPKALARMLVQHYASTVPVSLGAT